MRVFLACVTALGYAVASPGVLPSAQADTFSMAAGMQSQPGPVCFSFSFNEGNVGAVKNQSSDCFEQQYVMPLYWRRFYWPSTNRTVQVRGKVPEGSLMGCALSVYDSDGFLVSQDIEYFPETGASYDSISLTVNNVTSSSTSFVACSSIGTTWLMKVDYSP